MKKGGGLQVHLWGQKSGSLFVYQKTADNINRKGKQEMRTKIEARVSAYEKESFVRQAEEENLSESALLRKILQGYLKRSEEKPDKNEPDQKILTAKKLAEKSRKEQEMKFRISNEEYLIINSHAQEAKLSVSAYIRKRALGEKVIVIEGLKDFAYELRKIGNNINQLANLANEGRIYSIDLSTVRENIKQLWKELRLFMEQQTENTEKRNGSY